MLVMSYPTCVGGYIKKKKKKKKNSELRKKNSELGTPEIEKRPKTRYEVVNGIVPRK